MHGLQEAASKRAEGRQAAMDDKALGQNSGLQVSLHWLQEVATKRAEGRRAAMDEPFRAESSDEEEYGESAPMLQRENSAALNAKLSFELPGQSGLQVSTPY